MPKSKWPWLIAVAAALLVASNLWLGHQNTRLREEASALAKTNAALTQSLAAERAAAKTHEADRTALALEADRLRKELSDAYAADEGARAWRDEPCPDAVQCRLRYQD